MESQDTMRVDETSSSSSSCSTEYSSLSSSLVKRIIRKTRSNKRKSMLVINGYNFQLKNFNKNKINKFCRCAKRNSDVLLHMTLNDTLLRYSGKVTDHSHLPNPAELEIRNLRETMPQKAENELLALQEVAEQEVQKALLTAEALAVLPSITNIGMVLIFLYNINTLVCFFYCLCLSQVIT